MKHVIWSNVEINLEDYEELFAEYGGDLTEEKKWELVYADNSGRFFDEQVNTNKFFYGTDIVLFGTLGLWNGKHRVYKTLGNNLSMCLHHWDADYEKFYVEDGEYKYEGIHHDGTNNFVFRRWRKNVSDSTKERVMESWRKNEIDSEELLKWTCKLGVELQKIYGWKE